MYYITIPSPTQPTCDQTCIDSRTQKKPCIEGPFSFSICGGIYSVHTYAVNFQWKMNKAQKMDNENFFSFLIHTWDVNYRFYFLNLGCEISFFSNGWLPRQIKIASHRK